MDIDIPKKSRRDFYRIGIRRPGWTDGWQEGWEDYVAMIYWNVIPYRWRPTEIWRRFSCWGWKRYTTIRPRTIKGHGYVEPGLLLPHVMFELLVRHIESEQSRGKKLDPKLMKLYNWWQDEYVPFHEMEMSGTMPDNTDFLVMFDELKNRCHELVDLQGMMWRQYSEG